MALFGKNNAARSAAITQIAEAENLQQQQADIDLRRSILANIRQERIAEAQVRFAQNIDDVTTSGTAGALGNIQSSFAEPIEYMYGTTARSQKINTLYSQAQENLNKYAKSVKRAGTVGKIVGTAATIVGTAIAPGIGTAIGAAIGTAAGAALGGRSAAIPAAQAGVATGTAYFTGGVPIAEGLSTKVSGKNGQWARAQNRLNWSTSQYYGTSYKPVSATEYDWGGIAGGFAGIVKQSYIGLEGDKNNNEFLTKLYQSPTYTTSGSAKIGDVEETWGTRSSYSYYGRGLA